MRNEASSPFEKPEFKANLAKYEQMVQTGVRVYFEPNELALISEYYAGKEDFLNADKALDYALEMYPENFDIQLYKCHSLISQKKLEEAGQLLRSLPDSNDYEVKLLYAELELARNHFRKSQKLFNELYEENQDIETALDIAQICMDYQERHTAYIWIENALMYDPEDLEALEMKAAYLYAEGELAQATWIYERILEKNPYHVETWLNLTRAYMQSNELDEAMEAVEFALSIDESNLTAWELKADICMLQENISEALEYFTYVEEHAEEKDYLWNILAYLHFELHHFDEVIKYTGWVIDKYTESYTKDNLEWTELYYRRAMACYAMNQWAECIGCLLIEITLPLYDHRFSLLAGVAHLHEHDLQGAQTFFDNALRLTDNSADTQEAIALAYLNAGYYDTALDLFMALTKDFLERTNDYDYFLACCYFHLGRHEESFKHIVRGAYYTTEFLLHDKWRFLPGDESEFFQLAEKITNDVNHGLLNPCEYLD